MVRKWFPSREKDKVTEADEITIHVRKNGSRYVDPDEFFQTPGIKKLVDDLKDLGVKPDEKSGA